MKRSFGLVRSSDHKDNEAHWRVGLRVDSDALHYMMPCIIWLNVAEFEGSKLFCSHKKDQKPKYQFDKLLNIW